MKGSSDHISKESSAHVPLVAAIAVTILAASLAQGQASRPTASTSVGEPIISTPSQNPTTSPDWIYLDVAQVGAAHAGDICKQIADAWAALNNLDVGNTGTGSFVDGAVLDARSIVSTMKSGGGWNAVNCTVDPFSLSPGYTGTTGHHGVLLLGSVLISTTVPWAIPGDVSVEGIGPATSAGTGTTIQAASGIGSLVNPCNGAVSAVVCLGRSAEASFSQVRDLTIDCNGEAGIGLYNGTAEEGSYGENLTIMNATTAGIEVRLDQFSSGGKTFNGAVNSGPYHNITVEYSSGQTCTGCSSSTVGVLVANLGAMPNYGGIVRGFDNLTVSGNHACSNGGVCTNLGSGYLIEGAATNITNTHVEFYPTSLQVGDTGLSTNGVLLSDVFLGVFTTGVEIVSPGGSNTTGDVTIAGLSGGGSASTLNDQVGGNTLSDSFLAFYALGHESGTTGPTVLTTSPSLSNPLFINGALTVQGNLTSNGTKHFQIDDPLDPANKYLTHASVESSEMLDVYSGNATTDGRGFATVKLPDYFQALNRDFRYQLSTMGQFAQATVTKEIAGNQFTIQTDKPGVRVSWQVTGVRQDAYARTHPMQVESEKPERERARYSQPAPIAPR